MRGNSGTHHLTPNFSKNCKISAENKRVRIGDASLNPFLILNIKNPILGVRFNKFELWIT
jgi:hypothetical protein